MPTNDSMQRDVITLMSELAEMSRQLIAQVDERCQRLERLIQQADARIAQLRAATAGPSAEKSDTRYEAIYALADQGHDAQVISQKLNCPRGEIELILALRGHP